MIEKIESRLGQIIFVSRMKIYDGSADYWWFGSINCNLSQAEYLWEGSLNT